MRSYLAAFLMALMVAATLTPLVLLLARRLGAVSIPGGRHVHARFVPRLGGVGIAIATLSPLLALFVVDSEVAGIVRERADLAITIVTGASFICFIGAWDDARGLGPLAKLAAQVLAALGAYAMGFRIDGMVLPLVGQISMGAFAPLVTVFWIVGITNAVNLIDGLDGLAAGVVFFAAATNFTVAILQGTHVGTVFVALLMASLMGALLGFLLYNFNPARIFMGDSGSYFLGYLLALAGLTAPIQKASTAVSLVVPMLALGLPIFDTFLSIARRYVERRPVFLADRGHIHHRLLDMGITHRRAVVTLYAITAALAALAIATTLGRRWSAGVAVLGASVLLFGLVRFLGYFDRSHTRFRQAQRFYDPFSQMLRHAVPGILSELQTVRTFGRLRELLGPCLQRIELSGARTVSADANQISPLIDVEPGSEPVRWLHFPLDNGSARLELATAPTRRLTPEATILLQLVSDAIGHALERCKTKEVAPHSAPTSPIDTTTQIKGAPSY